MQDFHEGEYVDRELVLVKVAVDSKSRAEVMQITDIFRAKIVDVQPKTLTIEITGSRKQGGEVHRPDGFVRRAGNHAHRQDRVAKKIVSSIKFSVSSQASTQLSTINSQLKKYYGNY